MVRPARAAKSSSVALPSDGWKAAAGAEGTAEGAEAGGGAAEATPLHGSGIGAEEAAAPAVAPATAGKEEEGEARSVIECRGNEVVQDECQ